jgi:hypothetical protein
MPLNIEEFRSQGLTEGGARPSLFEVILPDWPGSTNNAGRKLTFLAKAASIPPSVEGSIEVPYQSRRIKVVGDRQYANWVITVMNDTDFIIRTSFEQWHQNMNQHVENIMNEVTPSPASYKRDALVRQLGKDGAVLKVYTLKGLFPLSIEQISLDWEANDQIELFDVEFSVDYWLPYDQNGIGETESYAETSQTITI